MFVEELNHSVHLTSGSVSVWVYQPSDDSSKDHISIEVPSRHSGETAMNSESMQMYFKAEYAFDVYLCLKEARKRDLI